MPPSYESSDLIYFNFQPFEVVSRYRDPQLQVSNLLNLGLNVYHVLCI